MPTLLSCQSLTKSYGTRPLFTNITFGIEDDACIGLIGPNGSGKSTLLKILAGRETPDTGAVSARRNLAIGYVAQDEVFPRDATVESAVIDALKGTALALHLDERDRKIDALLTDLGFEDKTQSVATLSGGWRKRLAFAVALIREPELLLMDEPTNHLDIEGVLWLEALLKRSQFAYLVVSHDRAFLENVVTRTVELNPVYVEGYLSSEGSYTDFLIKREEYRSSQLHQQDSIETKLRREIAWLRRGAKARTTKAKGRIEAAGDMMVEAAELKFRNTHDRTANVSFTSSGRRTKELMAAKGISKSYDGKTLFENVDILLTPGTKLGLLGSNGSGKTTLLKILTGDVKSDTGTVTPADGLNIVWFDQDRTQLDKTQSLKNALSPNSDNVDFRGSTIHVSAWAKRFGFSTEQMNTPISYLSGGEQARILIAQLMLRSADILILDEPTNDLDIPTLEVLEESLSDFKGAMILVTHDRYLMDAIATEILALDATGGSRYFADLAQWETWQKEKASPAPAPAKAKTATQQQSSMPRLSLSSSERRELANMEGKIEAAETKVAELEALMLDPKVASDAAKLQETWNAVEAAKVEVTRLYERWEELEARRT